MISRSSLMPVNWTTLKREFIHFTVSNFQNFSMGDPGIILPKIATVRLQTEKQQ